MVMHKPGRVDYVDLGVTLANIAGVTGQVRRFLFTGSQYVLAEYDTTTNYLELNYWDTDGSEAVSRIMAKTNVLDLVYDAADSKYYAVRFNTDAGFEGTPGYNFPSGYLMYDDFSTGHPTDTWRFKPEHWYEPLPSWGSYSYHGKTASVETSTSDTDPWLLFRRNPETSKLEYKTNVGRGILGCTAATSGDFQAYGTFKMTSFPGPSSVFSMRLIDQGTIFSSYQANNLLAQATFWGPYSNSNPNQSGRWQASHAYLDNDSTNGKWTVSNLRLVEKKVDDSYYTLTSGTYHPYKVSFYSYVATNDTNYFKVSHDTVGTILASGVVNNTSKTFDFVDGPIAFTLFSDPSNNLGNLNGTSLNINVRIDGPVTGDTNLSTISGTTHGFRLGVGVQGTNLYARRDIDAANGYNSWENIKTYNLIPTTPRHISVELFSDCRGASSVPDVTMDDFYIESIGGSTATFKGIPSLSVEAYDLTGASSTVASVTDASGYAIRRLDAINRHSSSGGSLGYITTSGIVAITSDQKSLAQNGSLSILVRRSKTDNPVVYKFNKSSLPLANVETGSSAFLVASGTLDNHHMYKIGNFMYTSYSGGQLGYVTDNWPDYNRGVFLNTLLSGTLSGTNPRRTSWLQHTDFYAFNINDFNSLYGVTVSGTNAGKVRLYNVTPTTAAFCNVVSNTRLLAAGTNQTSLVTAQVMNTYGEPLPGKTVSFTITAGDGSLNPASAVTNNSGEASSTYTVGTAVTVSTVVATVNI